MVSILKDELHDTTLDASSATRVYDWINRVQEDMDSRGYWSSMESATPTIIKFTAPYQTGTVAITLGATAVTGSGTTWTAGMVGQVITIASDANFYFIAAVGGATSLTLSNAYLGSTQTVGTYVIDYLNVALPSGLSLSKIKSIVLQNPDHKLVRFDQADRDERFPTLTSYRSVPTHYLDWGETYIQPWPLPDTNYLATIRYQKLPTAVTSASTAFDWPVQLHQTILTGALAFGWEWKDSPDVASQVRGEYEMLLKNALATNNRHMDHNPQMRPFDVQSPNLRGPQLVLGRRILG